MRRVARSLDRHCTGHRVQRWVQPDATTIVFELYGRDSEGGEASKLVLSLCCREETARISGLERMPQAPERPPAFSSYLRAHLSRALLRGVEIRDDDRQLELRFEAKEGEFRLLLSIFGRRSNVYLLGDEDGILASLRPFESTRPELAPRGPYRSPSKKVPVAGRDRFEAVVDADLLTAIEDHYAAQESERSTSDLAAQLLRALRREAKGARRRFEKIERELAEADRADEYARHGELLKGALKGISPGDTEVRVRDYETDEEVAIPLDPKLSPKANLEATFKRYQKLLRRLTKAGGRFEKARDWLEELGRLEAEVERHLEGEEPCEEALESIAARREIRKLLEKRTPSASGKSSEDEKRALPARLRDLSPRLVPRRYRSKDGLEIWVGRSDEGNDVLTTRLARGNDLFFHLDGAPGSHVVLRTEGRNDPPSVSVLDACELAVRFSRQKNAGSANVHVVPIKQVKKPKGAKRGLVYVTGGKSIHLRREQSRLERLLDSVID